MSNYPRFDTKLFTEIWPEVSEFITDYQTNGIPMTINNQNATTLFYLLYAKYGNSPIANYDEEQFKYKVFSIIFANGPTWQKRLDVQNTLRGLQLSDLIDDGSLHELFSHTGSENTSKTGSDANTRTYQEAGTNTGTQAVAHTGTVGVIHSNDIENSGNDTVVDNHAFNPGTSPATNAFDPLSYINEQKAQKVTKGTKSEQDESSTTTYNNTDTTTNNLADAKSGTITDSREIGDSVTGQQASNDETTRTLTQGKLKAYEKLLELLETDVTSEFISKFKVCFKQFVMPERTWIYVTEVDDEEDDD